MIAPRHVIFFFDQIAPRYDDLWTNTTIGRLQREAVWRRIGSLFRPGERVLDLGCGTGEDAKWLMQAGTKVLALDASRAMVKDAKARGVDAAVLRIEDLNQLEGIYDGAISNFGALNCVSDLKCLGPQLARLIRRDGYFAVCVLGRFCLWETVWFLLHGNIRKAARRWRGTVSQPDFDIYYPTVRQLRDALALEFTLVEVSGIGLCIPPSYVNGLSRSSLARLALADRRFAHWPVLRALADHRLLIFVRR